MKKIISLVAIMSVIIVSSGAMAQPSPYDLKGRYPKQTGVYVAPKIVYAMQDVKAGDTESDNVMGGGLAIGYNFYNKGSLFPMRIEGEYIMREKAKFSTSANDYSYGVDTLMVNGAIGINTGTKITPYLTAGFGYSTIDGKSNAATLNEGTNNDFVWSVGADITYSINEHVMLAVEFRHIDFGDAEFKYNAEEPDLTSQELLFAFRYKF